MKSHVIGLFLGFGIIYHAMMNTGNDRSAYFDVMSFVIVFGGTLSVSIMTNGFYSTLKICSLFFKVFKGQTSEPKAIIKDLVDISMKSHQGKLNINEEVKNTYHPFLMDGLKLLHNKFESDKLRTIMTNMMYQRQEKYTKMIEQIEMLAKYPPAFGMMGTIIGLVAVLKQINSPDNMTSIGPSMAIALVTTLYGILLSNYVLQPIADNILIRSDVDIKIRQLIAEGMILISEGHDPVYIRENLMSYLSPNERTDITRLNLVQGIEDEAA